MRRQSSASAESSVTLNNVFFSPKIAASMKKAVLQHDFNLLLSTYSLHIRRPHHYHPHLFDLDY